MIQQDYAKEFHVFKPDKKLIWMSHLGSINLEVELEDRTVEAEVPPLEAAFIELFSQQGQFQLPHRTSPPHTCNTDEWAVADLIADLRRNRRPGGSPSDDSPWNIRMRKEKKISNECRAFQGLVSTGRDLGCTRSRFHKVCHAQVR